MGLDMYAFTTTKQPAEPVDFRSGEGDREIHCWRKHPINLHGWMERLYRDKGGADDQFNCANLQVTADDLNRREADVKQSGFPGQAASFSVSPTGRS